MATENHAIRDIREAERLVLEAVANANHIKTILTPLQNESAVKQVRLAALNSAKRVFTTFYERGDLRAAKRHNPDAEAAPGGSLKAKGASKKAKKQKKGSTGSGGGSTKSDAVYVFRKWLFGRFQVFLSLSLELVNRDALAAKSTTTTASGIGATTTASMELFEAAVETLVHFSPLEGRIISQAERESGAAPGLSIVDRLVLRVASFSVSEDEAVESAPLSPLHLSIVSRELLDKHGDVRYRVLLAVARLARIKRNSGAAEDAAMRGDGAEEEDEETEAAGGAGGRGSGGKRDIDSVIIAETSALDLSNNLSRILMQVEMPIDEGDLLPSSRDPSGSSNKAPGTADAGADATANTTLYDDAAGDFGDIAEEGADGENDEDNDGDDSEDDGGAGVGSRKRKRSSGSKKVLGGKKRKGKHLLQLHRKAFEEAWLGCLGLSMTEQTYKRVLLWLPENVMPHFLSPLKLADFLSDGYALGGLNSILALSGLFILMQCHNLHYPKFFQSLYATLQPSVFYAKHRDRYFRLLSLCLTSSMLPAYLVAAFIKRMNRLALSAPPSGALYAVALTRSLLARNRECLALINHQHTAVTSAVQVGAASSSSPTKKKAGAALEDEFDMATDDLDRAKALDSSLWEWHALKSHYYPEVQALAVDFERPWGKKEKRRFAVDEYVARTYKQLFDEELNRKTKHTPLCFREPEALIGGDDVVGSAFAL